MFVLLKIIHENILDIKLQILTYLGFEEANIIFNCKNIHALNRAQLTITNETYDIFNYLNNNQTDFVLKIFRESLIKDPFIFRKNCYRGAF
jgi:hypothetical protein